MPSFGDKLRLTRESHNATLEEIARTTKIRLSYLEALERNDFAALPGRAFGKFYIRAYGEVLGFDPQTLIEEYDGERKGAESNGDSLVEARVEEPRNAWQEALRRTREDARRRRREVLERTAIAEETEAEPEAEPEIAPAAADVRTTPEPSPPKQRRYLLAGGSGIAAIAALILLLRTGGEEALVPAAKISPAAANFRPKAPLELVTRPDEVRTAPIVPPPVTPPPQAAGRLSVPEFGVGHRMTNRRLEGRADRFEEGGVVWFQTLVLGGERGQRIRHVWLRDDKWVQTIELELGGDRWRTQSSKTLWGVGEWAVEARDTAGQVLARATFTCAPPRR